MNRKGKRVGITASAFDLLHAGHITMLKEAKSQCDYLICALHVDPSLDRIEKNTPIQNTVERYTQLAAVKYVDEIIPYLYEHELIDILEMYMPDVRILGDEYKDTDFTGRQLCDRLGIELYFNSRNHSFSSSGLRKRVYEKEFYNLSEASRDE